MSTNIVRENTFLYGFWLNIMYFGYEEKKIHTCKDFQYELSRP